MPEALSIEHAPVNARGIHRSVFAVDDSDDGVARLRAHGAELIGNVVQDEDTSRLCCIRGPEGIMVAPAEQRGLRVAAWAPSSGACLAARATRVGKQPFIGVYHSARADRSASRRRTSIVHRLRACMFLAPVIVVVTPECYHGDHDGRRQRDGSYGRPTTDAES
jgi:hypothetical protein